MDSLEQLLGESGYRMKLVGINRLEDLRRDIEENFDRGNVDANLQEWLKRHYKLNLASLERPFSSILILASKSPLVRAVFEWRGKTHTFVMPPTYLDFISEPEKIRRILERACGENHLFEETDNLPKKLLAVRSGLGRYGRNNLCYVPGLGSYVLLTAFLTDLPAQEDSWGPARQLEACGSCRECVDRCPCTALPDDRFAVHAETCVTYHNEFWGKPEFPQWLSPDAHNCLVGCLRCQVSCPENKGLLQTYGSTISFEEEETEAILGKVSFDELPEGTADKLKEINLHVHYDYLDRNLKALLNSPARCG